MEKSFPMTMLLMLPMLVEFRLGLGGGTGVSPTARNRWKREMERRQWRRLVRVHVIILRMKGRRIMRSGHHSGRGGQVV